MHRLLSLLFCLSLSAQVLGQTNVPEHTKTIDGIVNKGLEIISGEKGKVRDWDVFRNLFTPNATFAFVEQDTLGTGRYRSFSLEEFVRIGRRGYENNGFLEYELKKTVDEYNGIAHVFQGYYAKGHREEKGINSYQLYYDGTRWWITSILWASDENGVPIPAAYDAE
ncbi:MAG: hypothetical protein H6602_10715 [Flavobacteriales bacterium]|nr:hypothetical protein [Flavobacteriales bacterium]